MLVNDKIWGGGEMRAFSNYVKLHLVKIVITLLAKNEGNVLWRIFMLTLCVMLLFF